ncbi:MAG: tryptophan 2,3-dioxygenase family protein, partial [Bacteroidota bacterium]
MNRQLLPTEQVTKQQLERLRQKYARENQNLFCHLERLIHETTINYSDYLNIDTLLTLQKPRTAFPDELIFISYHQIVELFFRLIRWELEQLTDERTDLPPDVFADKVQRINRYFRCVIDSFDIMANGLDKKQFVQFRYALFPASGFQSLQYRMIELWATDAPNLVSRKWRSTIHNQSPAEE